MEVDVRAQIIDYVSKLSIESDVQIDDSTEIYFDLGIYGDDLFDLCRWLASKYGVDGVARIGDYGPEEELPAMISRKKKRIAEKVSNKYKSLKVGDLIRAAYSRTWATGELQSKLS